MIFVTTPTGTVGSALVNALKSARAPFRAGYRSPDKAAEAKSISSDTVLFDYQRSETFPTALRGVEKVFLLSPPGLNDKEAGVIDAAKAAGVKHVVKLSVWDAGSEAYGFARDHRPIEKKLEQSGVPFTILRANGFMQNFISSFAPTIKSQGAFYLPAKDSRVSIIDVRDIAAVAAKVLTSNGSHQGKTYALSGPESLSNAEIAEKFSRALGKKVNYVDLSDQDFKKSLLQVGVPEKLADGIIELQHYYIRGKAALVTPDVEAVTGKRGITFDQFVRDNISAFQ
jgi:uncharacterized protein YbjT (DUF2867 family)